APDIVKLDTALTREVERDVARHAMVAGLVTFADRVDARLVAEGIETPEARDILRSLGVRFGQGYLFARPRPAREVTRDLAEHGWRIAS
ncbi:MAG TPA: EAL domain-containing protein, partial [Actinomycetota bacterium]|nr:EAL domain-containing protein [Actinomycetota bacterium]